MGYDEGYCSDLPWSTVALVNQDCFETLIALK
jgi:hypothetical protein